MKKISLKTIRKSFNIKGKNDTEFAISQPDLAASFSAEDSLFGGCYSKDLVSSDLDNEDENRSKVRSKGEGLMGSLKRRLSSKQKPKVKGGSPSVCSLEDDAFSSSSAPITLTDLKSSRSKSVHSHHYIPTPWPLRPMNAEETCIKMDVNALKNSNSSNTLNSVHQDLVELQREFGESSSSFHTTRPVPGDPFPTENGDLHLEMEEHVPVVIGIASQDYIDYPMPLDDGLYAEDEGPRSFCIDSTTPMDVVSQSDGCRSLHPDEEPNEEDLLSPDIFLESSSVNQLFLDTANVLLQGSRLEAPLSPLLPPLPDGFLQRSFSGFGGTHAQVAERVMHHLNFDPNTAPGVQRVYDAVQNRGPMVVTSLTAELKKLAKQGWYWGPITRWEAEEKLTNLLDGSFLVRDSSDDRYLLSLSFRSQGKTLHTRIEHSNGSFSFYEQPDIEGHVSIVDLIDNSVKDSENGAFCYSRSRLPGSATYPVRLTNPVSRFMQVRSLQYSCRFVIRQYTRIDLIQKLPLPNKMKDYLQEKHY
ncbi:hypothetical protein DNTS_013312 [Danionella cerebrum]|uniref:Suppressor of cytokine signaling 6 n=1 Tax=Danionella cerebrum TaxID=2873325 RepID=A0A553QQU4_9TELE|nr:hypothetical protein DNTS_013312 [Danionella translucida]